MAPSGIDGRTARRDANRERVVDAMMTLFDEGDLEPRIEDIVERSGVSARSVFRYFDGLDDLRRAVMQRTLERAMPLMTAADPSDMPLPDRIASFVDRRVEVCEAIAGPARVALLNAPFKPMVAEEIGRFRGSLAQQVRAQFDRELGQRSPVEREDLEVLIGVVVSFDAWDLLTTVHQRTQAQIVRAWVTALARLLTP